MCVRGREKCPRARAQAMVASEGPIYPRYSGRFRYWDVFYIGGSDAPMGVPDADSDRGGFPTDVVP